MVISEKWERIKDIPLSKGKHDPDSTFCVMEMVAYVAGEPWTDTPECASPVLTKYCQVINDSAPDEIRQKLKPYVLRLIGSRDEAKEMRRMFLLTDRAVWVFVPLALEVAQLADEATKLRDLPPITDATSAARAASAADSAARAANKIWAEALKALDDALSLSRAA